jgi:hypothetical protein
MNKQSYNSYCIKLIMTHLIKSNVIPNDCTQIIYNNIIDIIVNNKNINSIFELNIHIKYNNFVIDSDFIWKMFYEKNYEIIKYIINNKLYRNIVNSLDLLIYCFYSNINILIFDFVYKSIVDELPSSWESILIRCIINKSYKKDDFKKYFIYFNDNKINFYIDYDDLFDIAFTKWKYLGFIIDNNIIVKLDYEKQDIEILNDLLHKEWTNASTIYLDNYLMHKYDYTFLCNYYENKEMFSSRAKDWLRYNLC